MTKSGRLPTRFPEGAKYVLEAKGDRVRRYVEFPNGQKVRLRTRKAMTCCAGSTDTSIVPKVGAGLSDQTYRKFAPARARLRSRALERA